MGYKKIKSGPRGQNRAKRESKSEEFIDKMIE